MIILVLLGLILGSFVNAFVWRLHEQETLKAHKRKPSKKQLAELSIMKGRSMCPDCHHDLAAKDLVPLFSWLALGGRCRYCHKPISWQYPAVEALTAVLFGLSYGFWPLDLSHASGKLQLAFWLFFLVMFMALAVYDLRWYLLPNKIVYPLIVIAVVEVVMVAVIDHSWSHLWQSAVAALVISGLFWILFQISDGTWIGGGDVKLAAVLGLLAATPIKSLLLIFISSLIGTLVSLPLMSKQGKGLKMKVPFGPFLLAGCAITVLFGDRIIDWYTKTLL